MRLPIAPPLSTKDGTSNKNARLTNCLKEAKKTGDKAVIRPGLVLDAQASGVGNGLVSFNGELVSVYGATLGLGVNDPETFNAIMDSLDPADVAAFRFIAVNNDGTKIGGVKRFTITGFPVDRACIWSVADGFVDMGALTALGAGSIYAIADTGRAVGNCYNTTTGLPIACYWDSAGSPVALPSRVGDYTNAYGISADGTVIVGVSTIPEYYNEETEETVPADTVGMKWTVGVGYEELGANTAGYDISDDKLTIVGLMNMDSLFDAGKWTSASGWVNLAPSYTTSFAKKISPNGQTIVGWVKVDGVSVAAKWTNAETLVVLDTVTSAVNGLSSDGTFLVGQRTDSITGNQSACIWNNSTTPLQINAMHDDVDTWCEGVDDAGGKILGIIYLSAFIWHTWFEEYTGDGDGTIPALTTITGTSFDFAQSPL